MKESIAMQNAINNVRLERQRQIEKWGDQYHNPRWMWFTILAEEMGEVAKAMMEIVADFDEEGEMHVYGREAMREEVVQVAAVALAWIEAIDISELMVYGPEAAGIPTLEELEKCQKAGIDEGEVNDCTG